MNGRAAGLAVGGLLASAILHASAFWALAAMLAPEPAPEQSRPQSRLDVEALDVPTSDARPMTPQADAVAEGPREASSAQQGVIAQTDAKAIDPVPRPVAEVSATSEPVLTASLPSEPLAPANPTEKLQPTTNATTVIASVAPSIIAEQAALPEMTRLPATEPNFAARRASPPPATKPERAEPRPTQLANLRPDTPKAPAQDLPVSRQTAALAWSGDGNNNRPMAAASLAAIAAFTRPQDATSGANPVRDGIEAILASVPCARLQTVFSPETGQLEVRGHIPEDGLRGPVMEALQAQVGASIPLSDQLLILPRPQCAALAGIAGIGLPQSTEQLTNPRVIGEGGFARTYTYANGERLELDLQAPDYPGYIYVDYFTADGMVLHLQPNEVVGLDRVDPKSAQSVGRRIADQPSLDITIGPPFGQEIAAAFATSVPLYQGLRPLQEPAAPYLDYLRRQVERARAADPDFKGEWVYFFISTVP